MLKEGPWNFDNKLILLQPRTKESPKPPEDFQLRSHMVSGVWSYPVVLHIGNWTPISIIVKDIRQFEVCNQHMGLANFIISYLFSKSTNSQMMMIHIAGEGLVQEKVQIRGYLLSIIFVAR